MASVTAKVFEIPSEQEEVEINFFYHFICILIVVTIIMFFKKLIGVFYRQHDPSYEAKLD